MVYRIKNFPKISIKHQYLITIYYIKNSEEVDKCWKEFGIFIINVLIIFLCLSLLEYMGNKFNIKEVYNKRNKFDSYSISIIVFTFISLLVFLFYVVGYNEIIPKDSNTYQSGLIFAISSIVVVVGRLNGRIYLYVVLWQ